MKEPCDCCPGTETCGRWDCTMPYSSLEFRRQVWEKFRQEPGFSLRPVITKNDLDRAVEEFRQNLCERLPVCIDLDIKVELKPGPPIIYEHRLSWFARLLARLGLRK